MPAASLRLPYPGLRSFRREESDLFFGREDCINAMVDRLAGTRFLAVLGSSGAGKSSVVKTGLLDALDLGLMASAGSTWRIVDFRPGGAPLKNLAVRLLETKTDGTEATRQVSDDDAALLRAFLLRGPRSIAEWCGDGHLPGNTNLLLLVDQFEELFRYQDYAGREEAEAFAGLLLESARQRQFPIYVALTMRSEYLGACALIDGLAEAISTGMFLIPRMTREQCRSAIVGPAAVCNFKIEDALANRLLNDLAAFAPWNDRSSGHDQLRRLGRRADQLPLLQYCLNRMWIRARDNAHGAPIILTRSGYDQIGGLEGALNAHADEILRALGESNRPVAEAAFRALTEGSGAADAVRRPTRFGELAEICNADASAVRAVVDAFRAPGCNFLAPELDPANPRPLTDESIIDISHESLIRQWKQLSEWVEAEARSRRQWLRLLDRFEDGQALQRAELSNMLAWRAEQEPNATWARRYGGDFPAVMKFLDYSDWQRRRWAPVIMPLFSLAAFSICMVFTAGVLLIVFHTNTSPPSVYHYVMSGSMATTFAFGLWRYAGLRPTRALLAGATILLAIFAGGGSIVAILQAHGHRNAPYLWNVSLAGPVTVTAVAIFVRRFRDLFIWMLLTGTYTASVLFFNGLSNNSTAQGFFILLGWCWWFALVGFQLGQSRYPIEGAGPRERFAAIRLGVFGLLTFVTITPCVNVAATVAFGSNPPSWWRMIESGASTGALAVTLAFGLRRYGALQVKTALLAGATVFALEFVLGTALVGVLLSKNIPIIQAEHWAGAVLFAPCALSVLAIFDRTFRSAAAWLFFAALFTVPYGTLVWLSNSSLISINPQVRDLLILLIVIVWIAAIGYWLQRARLSNESASVTDRSLGRGLPLADPSPSDTAKSTLPQAAV